MLIYEYKLSGSHTQFAAIDEALRIVQFIRNKCLRLWMDERGISKHALQVYCAVLAKDFLFASRLNSQARQASADRAWFAISRFYENCKNHQPGKKGYPKFQHNNRSVEYKTTGWKLEPDGKHLTFTDGCGIGRLRLVGNKQQQIAAFPLKQIKRVRIVQRADGYYCQFSVLAERQIAHLATGRMIGIDVGLKSFYTDSDGHTVDNPRHYRQAEKHLNRLHRLVSRKTKGSQNREKARKALAKGYLKVQRQREDFARKTANALGVKSYAIMHGIAVVAVPPAYTSQECSGCGERVQKTLSTRTHVCPRCGLILDRDENAALNILAKGLACTLGHRETSSSEENASGQTASTPGPKRTRSKQAG